MALAGAAWAEFHHVVVTLHERDHAQEHHVACTRGQFLRFEADAADEKILPFLGGESFPATVERGQDFAFGQLDLT